jgi:hypothetical protein
VSGRKKLLKQQVIGDMFAGKISVPEARARMAWIKSGDWQPAVRAMAVKSAAAVTGFERYDAHPDPQVREWARAAAEQVLVRKGLMPGPAPGRESRTVRFVPGTGPDGRFRWEQPQAREPGLGFAPPGTAGR